MSLEHFGDRSRKMGHPRPVPATVQDAIQHDDDAALHRLAVAGGIAAQEKRRARLIAQALEDERLHKLYDEAKADQTDPEAEELERARQAGEDILPPNIYD